MKAFIVAVLWLIALSPTGYYLLRQIEEDRVVRDYLEQTGLAGLPRSKASAVLISQQVRRDFEIDESRFKTLKMAARPFLREDTAFLLRHKEGLCGEGTRVLVNLLLQEGYDATRLTLYDRVLFPAHTLVSVKLDEHEFLLDSINSPGPVNELLNTRDIAADDFRLLHYSDDIGTRTDAARKLTVERSDGVFFDRFWLYSYEAIPYTKLLTKARRDVRVFNFDRPARIMSALAEKPNLIVAVGALLAAVLVMTLLHLTGAIGRLRSKLG